LNIDPRRWLPPFAAAILLAITLSQTWAALRQAGAWGAAARERAERGNPYALLDTQISRQPAPSPENLRNPFAFVERRAPARPRPQRPRPAPAPVVVKPHLTAIIFDDDPRALITYDGRNYTVRANSLFADFRVVRINRDEVVLEQIQLLRAEGIAPTSPQQQSHRNQQMESIGSHGIAPCE